MPWVNSSLINPGKKDHYRGKEIKEISVDGYTFRDLNLNGEFDIYEDIRESIDERAEDLLSQMALDEELNMLKGTGIGTILERKELNLDTGRRLIYNQCICIIKKYKTQ